MEAWIPDLQGNLMAGEGDNAQTLSKFLSVSQDKVQDIINNQKLNVSVSVQFSPGDILPSVNINVKSGEKLTLDNAYNQSIKNPTSDLTLDAAIPTDTTSKRSKAPQINVICGAFALIHKNQVVKPLRIII